MNLTELAHLLDTNDAEAMKLGQQLFGLLQVSGLKIPTAYGLKTRMGLARSIINVVVNYVKTAESE